MESISAADGIKDKVHYIAVTGVVRNRDGRYLICKRSPKEKIFPNKWCFPGGKMQMSDFISTPKDTSDHWLDIFEKTLKREIAEETGLRIKVLGYIASLALIRPNGYSTVIINMLAEHESGDVVLNEDELVDHAWVTLDEAKQYDLIENIYEQMEKVDKRHRSSWILA
jgi:8-oxo-dGTP diphosphatase